MTGIIRFGRNALGWGNQPSTNWRRSGTLNIPAASLPVPVPPPPISTALLLLLLEDA